jgi:hypothetical protein
MGLGDLLREIGEADAATVHDEAQSFDLCPGGAAVWPGQQSAEYAAAKLQIRCEILVRGAIGPGRPQLQVVATIATISTQVWRAVRKHTAVRFATMQQSMPRDRGHCRESDRVRQCHLRRLGGFYRQSDGFQRR